VKGRPRRLALVISPADRETGDDRRVSGAWGRRLARIRRSGLDDPLARGVILLVALLASVSAGLLGIGRSSSHLALAALVSSVLFAGAYVAVVAQALKRDKTVKFWRDRRRLQIKLAQEHARNHLLTIAVSEIGALDTSDDPPARSHQAMDSFVRGVFAALTPSQVQLAVLIVLKENNRCHILHSATSPESRWDELRQGRSCELGGSLSEKGERLGAALVGVREVDTATGGALALVVLHSQELGQDDEALLDMGRGWLELVARRWRPEDRSGKRVLRPVG
jgi:hypothetical protein